MPREFEKHPIISQDRLIFHKFCPTSEITAVTSMGSVPLVAANVFEYRSSCFVDTENYVPERFSGIYRVDHFDGTVTWAARQTKLLPDYKDLSLLREPQKLEESTYVVDIAPNGDFAGYSELRRMFTQKPFFKGKPFEQWSGTQKDYERRGLSQRRVFTLNAFSQMLYNLPVYSSDHFVHGDNERGQRVQPQKLLWEKLTAKSLATKFTENVGEEKAVPVDRFVFTQNTELIRDFIPSVNWKR